MLPSDPFVRMPLGRDVAELRHVAQEIGELAGLPDDRVQDLVLAFSEIATNDRGGTTVRFAVTRTH